MASLIEAVEDTLRADKSFIKIFILAVPVFCSYYLFKQGDMSNFYIIAAITLVLLLTFMTMIFDNIRNCTNMSLPGFNPIPFFITMIKLIFAVGPISTAFYFITVWLLSVQLPVELPVLQTVYQYVVCALTGSFVLTSYMLFAKSGKIFSAYNLVLISKYCVDIIIATLFFAFQMALLNAIVVGSVIYVFNVFWGLDNMAFTAICSYLLVFNVGVSGNYLAQIHYEVIPKQKDDVEKSTIL